MKKVFIIAASATMVATTANAGLLDSLLGREKEPTTLEEACNTDEIKKICPEILLGDMTMSECLMQNISNLSTKCAGFVKKSATEKIDAAKAAATNAIADADKSAEYADASAQKKAAAAEKAAAAQQSAQEVKDAATNTVEAAKQTGKGLLNLFK